ncbi:MAG: hypothetical protein PQJ59_08725 [Spirochaetales bacterium]|nr:hypothetical protein [Spirochaetales bacterium]
MPKVSEYVRKENRKRTLVSWGSAFLAYLLLILLYMGWEHLFRKDLNMNQGPVLVRLGEPEGVETPTPAPKEPEVEEQPPEEPVTPPEPEPEPSPVEDPIVEPEAEPTLPDPVKEPVVEETPSDTNPVKDAAPALPEPIKGSDAGNNYELNSEGGEIGRNIWVPIYLYLPLPRYIDAQVKDGNLVYLTELVRGDDFGLYTAEQNRAILLSYYDKKSRTQTLELKGPVPLDKRPEVWAILERAGYDMRNAEYKNYPGLSSITLNFSVVPSGSSQTNQLVDVDIKKSSNIDEIDEAVLYAFQQSTYYNNTEEPIKGRFTYRFY